MAATCADDGIPTSVMIQAMSWRAKYRKKDHYGEIARLKVRVETLGVHPKNRGGVYPAGIRCKSLCMDVLESGFVKEEMNHGVVVVEETPPEHFRSRGEGYVSATSFNASCSGKDELLVTCFHEPHAEVRYQMLAHNHMMLVLRAFITSAPWSLEGTAQKKLRLCDDKGRLSLAAVAEHVNGKELAELIQEGLDAEVLSWQMDVEEPTAASVISHALNKGQELALRTTEITAVAVLKGEIITQMSQEVGQRVAFRTVQDRVRLQLDAAADDPDLPEVFDFLIALGVGVNSYVDDLLEFASTFVDSKKRQLRFGAFAVCNKMPAEVPWTKVAVIKRSYRKKPLLGFCPSPEPLWQTFDVTHTRLLEELLRFFHVTCQPLLAQMQPQLRNKILGNVDVAAADAFWTSKQAKPKHNIDKMKSLMVASAQKSWEAIVPEPSDRVHHRLLPKDSWIAFGKTEVEAVDDGTTAVAVASFNEHTGDLLNRQVDFTKPVVPPMADTQLPWKEWVQQSRSLGAREADKATAVAVLQSVHEQFDTGSQPIELWRKGSQAIRVLAGSKVAKNGIWLPPCAPRSSKVYDATEHPHAVTITLKVNRSIAESLQEGSDKTLTERKLYVLPEFKMPTAVADDQIKWSWEGNESLHPFWCVRRVTEQQMARLTLEWQLASTDDGAPRAPKPRFNCTLEIAALSSTNIACVGNKAINRCKILDVPFLTNFRPLEAGEELFLEMHEKKKETRRKPARTWRDALKDEQKEETRQNLLERKKQKTSEG